MYIMYYKKWEIMQKIEIWHKLKYIDIMNLYIVIKISKKFE